MRLPESHFRSASGTRRDFLKKSLAGTVLLSSAGFLAQCQRRRGAAQRPEGASVFAVEEFSTLAAFCQAILPGPETSTAVQKVPYRIDQEVRHWEAKNQAEVKSLLALIENGTRYFFFSWDRFKALSLEDRRRYLRGWETSRFDFRRQALAALRMLAVFYYYAQDETWSAIGYDGPWIKASGH